MAKSIWWFTLLFFVVLVGPSLYAQAAVAATGAPPAPEAANEWGGALVWAFFSSTSLEWIKRHPSVGIITAQTTFFLQRLIGVVLAVAAALGVHWSFDATAGRLIVDGLVWSSIWTIGTEAARQWVLQELTYRTAVKPYTKAGG